jgi:glycosyltransferase involved in cell wall biosynthesis
MGRASRILFISGREAEYIRNRVLIKALREHFEVTVLTPNISGSIPRMMGGLMHYLISASADYDLLFVGFYGQPLAIALSWIQRKPLILDAYISTYETLCEDRQMFAPRSGVGRLASWLDRTSCRVADHVITDTSADAGYFEETFSIASDKLSVVYVGCDEDIFYPREEKSFEGRFEVFHYGAFLPLHGTEVIVRAAAVLKHRRDVHFVLGGNGRCYKEVRKMAETLGADNVTFVDWIPLQELPFYIRRASVCLGGHFSTIPKATRVISTKTFQFLAMRKPTIVGDNVATRELFVSGEEVLAVPMGDAEALANAIVRLADDPVMRAHLAEKGHALYKRRLTTQVIAEQLSSLVEQVACISAS